MARVDLRTFLEGAPGGVAIVDGGTGGALEDRGCDVRNPLWSSAALLTEAGRALTTGLHRDYLDAGADLVIANTHNADPDACRRFVALADAAERLVAAEHATGPDLPVVVHVDVGDPAVARCDLLALA